jgi:hypothetical protein
LAADVVTHFWVHRKMRKYKKKYIKRNPKNNRSEKRIAGMLKKCQNWLRRFKNAKG